MTRTYLLTVFFLSLLTFIGCGSKIPISSRPLVIDRATHDYQRLFDSVGDHCYPGDQFPANIAHDQLTPSTDLPRQTTGPWLSVNSPEILQAPLSSSYQYLPISLDQKDSQARPAPRKRAIANVDDLALLSDIDIAKFKDGDLIVIGPPAAEGEGFRPDDWYTVFRAIAGTEAPGVTIDPGPDARLMQVRYFGGIQNTALGNTFFEADRTLKLLSTGFDNFTCSLWPARPSSIPTELDLIEAEIGDGFRALDEEGGWHRFWFEPSDEPVETEGLTMRIPKNRLVVKNESVPPGRPSPKSAGQFASGITANFLGMSKSLRAFRQLQQDAALVTLAKWLRDKQIPVDEDWVAGFPKQEVTAATTPSITVLRAKLLDQTYLQYGIHGGVDFQKNNVYGTASPQMLRLSVAAEQSVVSGASTWEFTFEGRPYRAVRLQIPHPVQLRPQWIIWQHVVTRLLVQPKTYRLILPRSDFVVTNDTGDVLTLQVAGPISKTERISLGPPVVMWVLPGVYQIKIVSRCGTSTDKVTVAEGDRHQLRYWCAKQSVPVQQPLSTGIGYFIVNNNTGAALTVSVGGLMYTVSPGTSTIRLAPGYYAATITSQCGTATESFNVTNGSTYNGQYSCVTR